MALTIVLEDGTGLDPAANSYATEAEFDDYYEMLGIDISAISSDRKKVGLITACKVVLEYNYLWKGSLVATTQPLAFPRCNLMDRNGREIAIDEIPKDVKSAQIELARQIAINTEFLYTDTPETNGAVKRERLDVMTVEYYLSRNRNVKLIAQSALDWTDRLLKPYLLANNMFQATNKATY